MFHLHKASAAIEAIVGTTVAPTIALCIHPIVATSTRQGSIPFAPFAGGGDTLVAAAVLTTRSSTCTAVWCGAVSVNITSARNPNNNNPKLS